MSDKHAVIEVAGKKYEMSPQADGTLKAIPISDDTLFEVNVLEDGLREALKNDINTLTNKAYAELCTAFKNDIKGHVLKDLGFNKRSYDNAWEVDHCNGRMSVITSHLSDRVKSMFQTEVDAIIGDILPAIKEEMRVAIKRDLKEKFSRDVRYLAQEALSREAKELVNTILKEEVEKLRPQAYEQVAQAFAKRTPSTK